MRGDTLRRIVLISMFLAASRRTAAQRVEWPAVSGDLAATKYSPLADINRDTVSR